MSSCPASIAQPGRAKESEGYQGVTRGEGEVAGGRPGFRRGRHGVGQASKLGGSRLSAPIPADLMRTDPGAALLEGVRGLDRDLRAPAAVRGDEGVAEGRRQDGAL